MQGGESTENCQKVTLQSLLLVFPTLMTEATTYGAFVRDKLLQRAIKAMVVPRQDLAIAGGGRGRGKALGQKSRQKISN